MIDDVACPHEIVGGIPFESEDAEVRSFLDASEGDVQLTVSEGRDAQVEPDLEEGLSLRFVDCHGVRRSEWELLSPDGEDTTPWLVSKRDPRNLVVFVIDVHVSFRILEDSVHRDDTTRHRTHNDNGSVGEVISVSQKSGQVTKGMLSEGTFSFRTMTF